MLLTKEQTAQRPSLPHEDIDVPEFGGSMRVRAWTGAEYDEFGKAIKDVTYDGAMYAAAIAVSAVGEDGEKLFDVSADIDRVAGLFLKTTLERAYDAIRRMNKLGKEGVEDALKN